MCDTHRGCSASLVLVYWPDVFFRLTDVICIYCKVKVKLYLIELSSSLTHYWCHFTPYYYCLLVTTCLYPLPIYILVYMFICIYYCLYSVFTTAFHTIIFYFMYYIVLYIHYILFPYFELLHCFRSYVLSSPFTCFFILFVHIFEVLLEEPEI